MPVLLEAAVDALRVRKDGIYIDATYGRGGHSRAILDRLGAAGRLIGLDQDPTAIAHAEQAHRGDERVVMAQRNFSELSSLIHSMGLDHQIDGLLIDLGVSSPQLDDAGRGFSFRTDGPLDMRMNPDTGISAAEWLAHVDQATLTRVIRDFGEERYAGRIARAIIEAQQHSPLVRTQQLAEVIEQAMPPAARNASAIHPATRTFQAIRIALNHELDVLEQVLEDGIDMLAPAGRLVVISFHSLEDRLVKQAIHRAAVPPPASRRSPVAVKFSPQLKKIGKLVRPDDAECARNPRARSSKMRVAEKLPREQAV